MNWDQVADSCRHGRRQCERKLDVCGVVYLLRASTQKDIKSLIMGRRLEEEGTLVEEPTPFPRASSWSSQS